MKRYHSLCTSPSTKMGLQFPKNMPYLTEVPCIIHLCLIYHLFKISIINFKQVILISEDGVKSFNDISLFIVRQRQHEVSRLTKKKKSATRESQLVSIGIPTICLYHMTLLLFSE